MENMFCFQCEQTAGCTGCTGDAGVCGKPSDVAAAQDRLTGALISWAAGLEGTPSEEAAALAIECLFACITNVDFSRDAIESLIARVHGQMDAAGIATDADYDMWRIWEADEDIRSLKSLLLFGIRGTAAYAYHARVLGFIDDVVDAFLFEALAALAEPGSMEELLPLVMRAGEVNTRCMALLDTANTSTYGDPEPTSVTTEIEPGPFIIITGHDLYDLRKLLEQTEGKGINVYTHGEMLPAHAYPELKRFSHLKGNFGTAWQNQQREFDGVPAPILYTTNCLMPPRESYADCVFTCNVVAYDGMVHIGEDKDFTPVIEKALELGGYPETQRFTGINGGNTLTTGFGHAAVLGIAPQIVQAVKDGEIGHFFVVGGCDGIRGSRSYYTEFVKAAPANSVILTVACGKYRFNDLDLGTVAGLPRLLDMGQCNDAYSAVQVALALADAFECDVNELPLSIVLSWYEQKAVCVLLSLLALGIKGIRLGPTLPAFLSPNVTNYLVENFGIAPTGGVKDDLAALLA